MTHNVNRRRERNQLAAGSDIKSMTQQASIAANMIISAITLFTAGYWIGGQSSTNPRMVISLCVCVCFFCEFSNSYFFLFILLFLAKPLICGLFSAIGILMIETVLFIIRADKIDERAEKKSKLEKLKAGLSPATLSKLSFVPPSSTDQIKPHSQQMITDKDETLKKNE